MRRSSFSFAGLAAILLAAPAFAGETIQIEDAYARASGPNAMAGAAFMTLVNPTDEDDRLIAVRSDVSVRVELHNHIDIGDGVMQMREDEDGFPIPAGETHALARGGDHVMFMGLQRSLNHGDTIEVTLTFERAGDVTVEIPVDLERKPMAHGHGN